ncbi:MAG: flagellar protein FlgN [Dehalococcoidia bacterium]
MSQARQLESLLKVLLEQERLLNTLLSLAGEEQRALIHSDFPALEDVSARMLAVADEMEQADIAREAIVGELGAGDTLAQIQELADNLGIRRLGRARARLQLLAANLREAQEANARLILDAVRVRERWFGLLAGMGQSTYGSAGRPSTPGYGVVSRSA